MCSLRLYTYANSCIILSRVRDFVTNDKGFWIGWLDLFELLLQLQSIITAHNRWLPNTRSIPSWTKNVFYSIVTELVIIYESVTSSTNDGCFLTSLLWINHDWLLKPFLTKSITCLPVINPGLTEYRTLPSTVHVIPCLSVIAETCPNSVATYPLPRETR
jgi:hypothetical protein